MSTTLTTILLERSSGLCALLAIGTLASAWNRMEVQGVDTLYFFLVLDALYVTVSVMVFHPRIHLRVKRFFDRFFWREMEAKLQLVADGLESLRKNVLSLLWTLALSLVIQFFSVVIIWIVGLSIGVQAPFPVFLMFIPLVNLTIMIPFTINGLGASRECLLSAVCSDRRSRRDVGYSLPLECAVDRICRDSRCRDLQPVQERGVFRGSGDRSGSQLAAAWWIRVTDRSRRRRCGWPSPR